MTVKIAPTARQQFEDANGNPLTGGKLFTYLAGTSTKQATYTTSAGTVANANPIVLNASGYTPSGIYLTDGIAYKFVLAPSTDSDPPVAAIWTEDNISGINDPTGQNAEWVQYGSLATYLSATTFSVAGDQTLVFQAHRRLKTTNTAGTIYSTIRSSVYASTITTVTVFNDSGVLDSGLSAVYYGLLNATNPSLPGRLIQTSTPGGRPRENFLINGEMVRWTYGVTQTVSGYGSLDRWVSSRVGTTMSITRGTHTVGQSVVPGHPRYYYINAVTSVAGAGNDCYMTQRVDDIARFSGETVTFSFYAKATAAGKLVGVSFSNNYGSGGSTQVDGAGVNFALTTDWARYTFTYTVPDITGLTIGADNYLGCRIWFDAGSTFNTDTGSMGQQSGTFHIGACQLEYGTVATDFMQRTEQETLTLCLQYYAELACNFRGNSTTNAFYSRIFTQPMRANPTLTLATAPAYTNASALTGDKITRQDYREVVTVSAPGVFAYTDGVITASAEL